MTQNRTNNRRNTRCARQGFTLAELLMAIAIGSVLMLGTASMMISHIQAAAKSEAIQRLQEAWSRVQFLLDQEIQEASGNATSSTCSSLTLTVPNPDTSGSNMTITYALSGTDLKRTGPPIKDDGTLNGTAASTTELVMSKVISFCPTTDAGDVNYTLALQDASGITYRNKNQPSGAHTRSRVIN